MKPLSATAVSVTALAAVLSFSLPAHAQVAADEGADVEVDSTVTVQKDATVSDIARTDPDMLDGQEIVTYNGDRVGEIKKIMQDPRDDKIYAVVDADDLFEDDINDVMVPVDELALHSEDTLMMSQGMETRLKEMVFDEDDMKTLSD